MIQKGHMPSIHFCFTYIVHNRDALIGMECVSHNTSKKIKNIDVEKYMASVTSKETLNISISKAGCYWKW